MKIRRRSSRCLNCGRSIEEIYNFCPNCGQENTNRHVSFKALIGEFFNNYLSFDSKFGRSIAPFFFRPGKLTTEFINGRRVNYANPIRLYLIISLFHFFALNQFNNYKNTNVTERGAINFNFDSDQFKKEIAKLELDTLEIDLGNNERMVLNQALDSVEFSLFKKADSIKSERDLIKLIPTDGSIWPFENRAQILTFYDLTDELNISNDKLYDSLHVSDLSFFRTAAIKQTIKLSRATMKEMISFFIENLPLLMFILLPLFALLLKLLYVRRNKYYIMHLIHALHIHSLAFFLLGITSMIGIFANPKVTGILYIISMILILVYQFISFLNVYKQSVPKTLLKSTIYNFLYFFLLTNGMVIQILISLALY